MNWMNSLLKTGIHGKGKRRIKKEERNKKNGKIFASDSEKI